MTAAGKVYAGRLDEFLCKLYPPRRKRQGDAPASACGPDGGGDGLGGGGDGKGVEGGDGEDLVVWTSTMLRTGQTVAPMTLHREVSESFEGKNERVGWREDVVPLVVAF